MQFGSISIEKIVHSSFKIKGKQGVIYVDPWKLPPESEMADIILISHEHFDHCSPDDIKKIARPGTYIIGNTKVKALLADVHEIEFVEALPHKNFSIDGMTFKALPSYNVNKFKEGTELFHTKADGNLGFIIGIDNTSIFFAGDSDNVEEFRLLTMTNINIAMLPVSGTYVMTWQEAVEACKVIDPDIAIPMHWGEIVGSKEDAENFKKNVSCKVVIL